MPAADAAISVVMVTFNSADALGRSLPAITAELRDGDELIVCDNGSADDTVALVAELAPAARVIEIAGNPGFGVACNAGATAAANPLLLLLNPDAVVQPGFRDAIVLPLAEGRGWDAWQGLLTSGDGTEVNTWGGVVHFTGISWAGGADSPIAGAPTEPREITYASGGCLLTTRALWDELGGFSPEYFLYHEDTDLGLRMWLGGNRVGLEPRARRRARVRVRQGQVEVALPGDEPLGDDPPHLPVAAAVALAPALLATELALHLVAAVVRLAAAEAARRHRRRPCPAAAAARAHRDPARGGGAAARRPGARERVGSTGHATYRRRRAARDRRRAGSPDLAARVRRAADAGPRLRLPRPRRLLGPAARAPARLLAPGAGALRPALTALSGPGRG